METLEEWLTIMAKHNSDKRINLKTSMLMTEILNGNPNKMNLVVFDNAGGMQFSIWDFDTEEDARGFMALDTFREDLIFGYVINGVSILCEYQRKYPHWDLPQAKRPTKPYNFLG